MSPKENIESNAVQNAKSPRVTFHYSQRNEAGDRVHMFTVNEDITSEELLEAHSLFCQEKEISSNWYVTDDGVKRELITWDWVPSYKGESIIVDIDEITVSEESSYEIGMVDDGRAVLLVSRQSDVTLLVEDIVAFSEQLGIKPNFSYEPTEGTISLPGWHVVISHDCSDGPFYQECAIVNSAEYVMHQAEVIGDRANQHFEKLKQKQKDPKMNNSTGMNDDGASVSTVVEQATVAVNELNTIQADISRPHDGVGYIDSEGTQEKDVGIQPDIKDQNDTYEYQQEEQQSRNRGQQQPRLMTDKNKKTKNKNRQREEQPRVEQGPKIGRLQMSEQLCAAVAAGLKIRKEEDGVDFINVILRGESELGKLLALEAYTPFHHPNFGRFSSVRGLMLFLQFAKTGLLQVNDKVHVATQNVVINYGKELRARAKEEFGQIPSMPDGYQHIVAEAIWIKCWTNANIAVGLINNDLPFRSRYYDSQREGEFDIVETPWLLPVIEEIARTLKAIDTTQNQELQPDFAFLDYPQQPRYQRRVAA
jgi:hypothetical protein